MPGRTLLTGKRASDEWAEARMKEGQERFSSLLRDAQKRRLAEEASALARRVPAAVRQPCPRVPVQREWPLVLREGPALEGYDQRLRDMLAWFDRKTPANTTAAYASGFKLYKCSL